MLATNFIDKKATKFNENSVILNDVSKFRGRHTKFADITWEQIVGKNQSAKLVNKKLTIRTDQKQNRILSFARFLLPICYVHKLY